MIVEPINGNLDRRDAGVVRALVEQSDKRLHRIEGVREKHVPFSHPFDELDGRKQVGGDAPPERRIFEDGQLFLGKILAQGKQKFIIEIGSALKQ